MASLLTVLGLIFVTLPLWAAPLPDEDPTREWRGREYADVLYTRFRNIYPQIPLVIDPNELANFRLAQDAKPWTVKQALQNFKTSWDSFKDEELRTRGMAAARNLFPTPIAQLIHNLEFGDRLFTNNEKGYQVESDLEEWIKKQKDHSIYPDDLMIEALRLSDGHVVTAWLAAWNYLREHWSYASTRNYRLQHQKFKSMTGERHLWMGAAHYVPLDLAEQTEKPTTLSLPSGQTEKKEALQRMQMVITKRGDEYSYLYHRIGVELLAITVASYTRSSVAGWGLGTVGALGEFWKYSQTAGLDRENKKRIANDLAAATSGARLYSLISRKAKPPLAMRQAVRTHYVRSNKRKYGEAYQLPKGVPAHYFGSQVDAQWFEPAMGVDELKQRFAHSADYDHLVLNPVVLASSDDYERMHRGLADYIASGARDPELNHRLRQFTARIKAVPEKADVLSDLNLHLYYNARNIEEAAPDFNFEEAEARLVRHAEKAIAAATLFERQRAIQRLLRPPAEMCRGAFAL